MTDESVLSTILDRRRVMQGGVALLATAAVARPVQRMGAAKRIGVGQPDRTAEFYQGFMNAVKEEAKRLGYEVVESFSGPAPEKQLAELNAWIASGVDGLVVLPQDANA